MVKIPHYLHLEGAHLIFGLTVDVASELLPAAGYKKVFSPDMNEFRCSFTELSEIRSLQWAAWAAGYGSSDPSLLENAAEMPGLQQL